MTEPASMGAFLRAARRRRRVSIERAAEETRIRSDFLKRMESDEFDFLAPAYVRGFLRSYSRFLGIDPQPLVDEFDKRFGLGRVDTEPIVELQRRSTRRAPRERHRFSSWGVAATLAAAVLLGLSLVGLFQNDDPGPATDSVARDAPADQPATPEQPSDDPTQSATESPEPAPTGTALALADGIDLKVIATADRCWMQVYVDGDEEVPVFNATLERGQSETFSAEKEMKLLLGNAQGVELVVNGKNIGSPGGTVQTVVLPDDVKTLL